MNSMEYVLILVKTSYKRTPYDIWLKNTNVIPIILVSSKCYDEYKHLEHVYNFKNYETNSLVEQKAIELAKKFNIETIFALSESDIIRASILR